VARRGVRPQARSGGGWLYVYAHYGRGVNFDAEGGAFADRGAVAEQRASTDGGVEWVSRRGCAWPPTSATPPRRTAAFPDRFTEFY
jgi:hypothetical protein